MKPIYRMATKALHLTGDISRDEPNLCIIHAEDSDNYIGNWVEGFGFMKVKFPKETTRRLTDEEIKAQCKQVLYLAGRRCNGYTESDFVD